MADENNIVVFRTAAPSARLKEFDDKESARRFCKHPSIIVWPNEPILECRDCSGVVDPYYWIRERCNDWERVQQEVDWKASSAKEELEGLRTAIRLLRKEYKDEVEKARAERSMFVQPPRRSF